MPAATIVIQTFRDFLGASPHLHIIAADGCFKESGMFYTSSAGIDAGLLEPLFRHKLLSMLKKKGLITDRIFFKIINIHN